MRECAAGAVLHTRIGGELRYLLVLEHKGHIGFPKGHLEAGETEQQAALREIREETGIEATLLEGFCEELSYPKGDNLKVNTYYLASYEHQTPELHISEVAGIMVLPYEAALEKLTFENSRELLIAAHLYLESGCKPN